MVGSCRCLKENLDELRIERVCYERVTLVLFRRRALGGQCGGEQRLGRAFEKAVRRKPLARRTRALCKLNGGRGVEGGRSRHGSGGGGCGERGNENRWWKTARYRARSRDQVRSGADGGGAR